MGERRAGRGSLQVHLAYAFDRLLESKLAQAYEILVPGRERVVSARVKESVHEDSSDSHARVSSEQQREERTIASQTAALIEFAESHELEVPKEWVFEDEGFSGATLERPGLERVRDLAAEGHIQVGLAYAPDRLSRKYAYQILLIEEFARQGVETFFVKAPQSASPEDQLLVQFQGMIADDVERGIMQSHTAEVAA